MRAEVKIHLIGICGTGMCSLAGLLKAAGHDVRGSDEHVYPPMSTQLQEQNIACFEGFGPHKRSDIDELPSDHYGRPLLGVGPVTV